MATTASAFMKMTNAVLTGGTVGAAGAARAVNAQNIPPLVGASAATRLDTLTQADLATAGFAKNGVFLKTMSGTTAFSPDLTDLTSGATSYAGDTTFATVNLLMIKNLGAADMTIEVGGSNPFNWGYAGTTPKVTIPAAVAGVPGVFCLSFPTGVTVDSTHKIILFTPTSGGSMALVVGGA